MEVGWWALIVSSVSVVFTGLTYWRNRTPLPKWVIDWDSGQDDLVNDAVRCVARNRGPGNALDVELVAVDAHGRQCGELRIQRDVVSFGDELELWFNFDTETILRPPANVVLLMDDRGGQRFVDAIDSRTTRDVRIQLTYHHLPNLRKTRRIREIRKDPAVSR